MESGIVLRIVVLGYSRGWLRMESGVTTGVDAGSYRGYIEVQFGVQSRVLGFNPGF